MTKLTINTPVEVEIHVEDYLPSVSLKALAREIERRSRDTIAIEKQDFLDLIDNLVEMRFNDAFDLMEKASPYLVRAQELKQRQLDHILARSCDHTPDQEPITQADTITIDLDRINDTTKAMRAA